MQPRVILTLVTLTLWMPGAKAQVVLGGTILKLDESQGGIPLNQPHNGRQRVMSKITLKGNPVNTSGELPRVGSAAKDFKLVKTDLSEVSLGNYAGKRKILNIFPSVDTATCAMSVRQFNAKAAELNNTVVLCISADLPFAQKRFCGAEGINNVEPVSSFRSSFAKDYGLEMLDSPLKGLCSRAVVILDENNKVVYTEQVSEIGSEPHYEKALMALA